MLCISLGFATQTTAQVKLNANSNLGIGIGATKTLAKLANHIAKTEERKPGSYPALGSVKGGG